MPSRKELRKASSFELPVPLAQVLRQGEDYISSSHIINTYWHLIVKLLEWSFFYLLSFCGFGYGWVLFLATVYYVRQSESEASSVATLIPRLVGTGKKSEKEVLSESLLSFPAWVAFPDFSRAEWVNDLIKKLWPNFSAYATFFVKTFIEPKINDILERMLLDQVSKFQIKKVVLGSIPAFVGGIKVYSNNTSRDEIVLDCDVSYSGDARVVFTLQGISAEIKQINFRGMARITLKPLMDTFPFIGGFELYFLTMPTLDYSLGGVAASGEVPIIKSLVKNIVEGEIRSRFIWPNRFHVYLPFESVQSLPSKIYYLPKPSGFLSLEIIEGRNLLAKDDHFMGSGKSDPYVIVSVGERTFNFRDKFVPKTVNPKWNYIVPKILMEEYSGQSINFEVFDHDKTNEDDFLGRTSISMEMIVTYGPQYERWITLENVKHGEILVRCHWHSVTPDSDDDADDDIVDVVKVTASRYIVSVFIDHCTNLGNGKSSNLYSKCKLFIGNKGETKLTTPRSKTTNPIFEEGFLLLAENPNEDKLIVQVLDHKSSNESVLGQAAIPINYILSCPQQQISDMPWTLEQASNPEAKVYLTAKLYRVC